MDRVRVCGLVGQTQTQTQARLDEGAGAPQCETPSNGAIRTTESPGAGVSWVHAVFHVAVLQSAVVRACVTRRVVTSYEEHLALLLDGADGGLARVVVVVVFVGDENRFFNVAEDEVAVRVVGLGGRAG